MVKDWNGMEWKRQKDGEVKCNEYLIKMEPFFIHEESRGYLTIIIIIIIIVCLGIGGGGRDIAGTWCLDEEAT